VKFLVDNALSEEIAKALIRAGHEATHVRELDLQASTDSGVLAVALMRGAVVISPDTDFSQLLSISRAARPSILSLQTRRMRRPTQQAALVIANLTAKVLQALDEGAVVVIEDARVRVRPLPLP
jgi:predicted nuclease of predicted toxin-antitoxin system